MQPVTVESLQAEVADLETQYSQIGERLRRAREALRALQEYYAVADTPSVVSPGVAYPPAEAVPKHVPIWKVVVEVLSEMERPVPLAEMVDELTKRGVRLVAQRPRNSISALASQRDDLYVEGGKVGLAIWRDQQTMPSGPVAKRRRKRTLTPQLREMVRIFRSAGRALNADDMQVELRRSNPELVWHDPNHNYRHLIFTLRQNGYECIRSVGKGYYEWSEEEQPVRDDQLELTPSSDNEGVSDNRAEA